MAVLSYIESSAPLAELVSNTWVYIFGEETGLDLKIGHSNQPFLGDRLREVNQAQTTNARYLLLAGVRGSKKDEGFMGKYFAALRREDKGSRQEYFHPGPELVEYAAWLRGQWFTATREDERKDEHAIEDPSHWLPTPERRFTRPADNPGQLIQDYVVRPGSLPGPWAWFPNPTVSFQDFFTPPSLIDCARRAMGGIDLDAASHWAANRVHRIPDYFDAGRSAFTHDWHGRVWLNPPYGDNGPWFARALHFIEANGIDELCMLSPVWAFSTVLARDFMRTVSAMLLLSPTPKFWRNEEALRKGHEEKLGSNHPHAIVYVGPSPQRFLWAFRDQGIAMHLASSDMLEEIPT